MEKNVEERYTLLALVTPESERYLTVVTAMKNEINTNSLHFVSTFLVSNTVMPRNKGRKKSNKSNIIKQQQRPRLRYTVEQKLKALEVYHSEPDTKKKLQEAMKATRLTSEKNIYKWLKEEEKLKQQLATRGPSLKSHRSLSTGPRTILTPEQEQELLDKIAEMNKVHVYFSFIHD